MKKVPTKTSWFMKLTPRNLGADILKRVAANIHIDIYERVLAYAILKQSFPDIKSCPTIDSRHKIWDYCLNVLVGDKEITYIEFGVHNGHSIRYFANKNQNRESVFIGLDSFYGLPERWRCLSKGHFNTNGKIPDIMDNRVTFIKGWFQDTYGELNAKILDRDNFVVHYDADLYSSTLFALTKIDELKRSYLAIFDQFTGHETRALYNYAQAYNANLVFLAKTLSFGSPTQLLCKITPHIIDEEQVEEQARTKVGGRA